MIYTGSLYCSFVFMNVLRFQVEASGYLMAHFSNIAREEEGKLLPPMDGKWVKVVMKNENHYECVMIGDRGKVLFSPNGMAHFSIIAKQEEGKPCPLNGKWVRVEMKNENHVKPAV